MPKLTKKLVDSLKTTGRDHNVFDSELPGFGIRIKPSGAKSYFIQYRNRAGRTRKLTLGRHGILTPAEGRAMARDKLAEIRKGADPSEDRQTTLRAPTLREFADRYLSEHAEAKKRPRSVAEDRRMLQSFILPGLGKRKLADISRGDVQQLHHELKATPYQANRVLALLSKMLNLAEKWGVRPDGSNPCRHVERYREQRRERFLSAAELARLGEVLAEAEADGSEPLGAVAAIRLLILTGCRRNEILELQWEQVDFERGLLWFEESKTGRKVVPLGAAALELLSTLPRLDGNPYVIFGGKDGGRLVDLHWPWARMRKRAGLEDVRLHDLRHSFASVGASAGLSLPIIGKLLGHTQAATTQRYAHLAADPVKQAADRISSEIAAAMNGTKPAEVVKIDR